MLRRKIEKILNDSSKVASILEDDEKMLLLSQKDLRNVLRLSDLFIRKFLKKWLCRIEGIVIFFGNWKPEDFLKHPKLLKIRMRF